MYLRIDESFDTHTKTLRFCRLMMNPEASAYLLRLWTWACRSAPDGNLTDSDAYDIEIAVRYRPLDGKCYAAMVAAGFVDENANGTRTIHNWMKRTGADIQAMEAEADRQRIGRKHRQRQCGGVSGGCPICERDANKDRTPDVRRTAAVETTEKRTQSSQGQSSPVQASLEDEGGSPPPARDPVVRRTGHDLTTAYGQVRSTALEGTVEPWRTPFTRDGKAETFAATLSAEEAADVRATMTLHFADLRAGLGKAGALENPTFGFGCWMAEFTALRERLHGKTPTVIPQRPPARASPPLQARNFKAEATEAAFEVVRAARAARQGGPT